MSSRTRRKADALRPGVVSIVLLNYRTPEETIECLSRLGELDWPADRLEVICVDNASGDGSAERIRAAAPAGVRVVESPSNTGFAGGCNFGAALATGQYVAFLNNDARADSRWLRAAEDVFLREPRVACVASKVLDWDGVNVDFVDAAVTFYGMGYKPGAGMPLAGGQVEALAEQERDVLFGTGSAMIMRLDVFREVGGFDERFFMFYEDVDLGWRLNLLGWRVRYVPGSLAFHKHHGTIKAYGNFRERYLLERNALLSLYKNVEDGRLAPVMAASLALAVRRTLAMGDDDASRLDLVRSPGGDDIETMPMSKIAAAGPYAVDYFVEQLPSLQETRKELQGKRRLTDRELQPLFGQLFEPAVPNTRYIDGFRSLVDGFGLVDLLRTKQRILIITEDPLAAKMAGPAIRAFHMAQQLAREHDVRLVSTTRCELSSSAFECRQIPLGQLRREEAWADVIIFQGFVMNKAKWLRESSKVVVVDLYDPMHLEQLEMERPLDRETRIAHVKSTTSVLNEQILRGDFFLCASEKQRSFWLGQMAAVGRLNVDNYDNDSTLRGLIAVCPFGLPSTPPVPTKPAIRGVVDGIGPSDKVILWAGGVYDWFDPLTLVRAIDRLRHRRDDVRLYFLGMQHPNPAVPRMRMASRTMQLADELGLTNKYVFWNESWVPYEDRQNFLLEADLGVSTHFDHVETSFSFRTRILDYLWAGLPIVATGGDSFGDLIEHERLGLTVPERDVAALTDALERMLADQDYVEQARENVAALRPDFTWEAALEPLAEFCRNPRRAADRTGDNAPDEADFQKFEVQSTYVPSVRGDLGLVREYFAEGGVREVTRRAVGRLRKSARRSAGLLGRR
jgi:GT2 family glycosyltransferase/glycosyltransferase involved in cell wall biosynthesis